MMIGSCSGMLNNPSLHWDIGYGEVLRSTLHDEERGALAKREGWEDPA